MRIQAFFYIRPTAVVPVDRGGPKIALRMMRKTLAALALAASMPSMAQDATLTGKVTDASSGEALIGVNVTYAPAKAWPPM